MMKPEFRPFRQIPHDYDYEGSVNPELITAQTSVLISENERQVMQNPALLAAVGNGTKLPGTELPLGVMGIWFVSRYINAPSSAQRRIALNDISTFCGAQYPVNYNTILDSISVPLEVATPQIRLAYKDLLRNIEHEFKAPAHLRLRFMFEDHDGYSPVEVKKKKEDLTEEFRGFFRVGEQNIFLVEEPTGISRNPIVRKGLELYGTPYRSYAYIAARTQLKREPTADEVKGFEAFARSVVQNNESPYFRTVMEVLENVYEEYNVRTVYEAGQKRLKRDLTYSPNDFEQWRQQVIRVDQEATSRNKIIVGQIEQVEEEAESTSRPTNVLVLLGTNHEKLLKLLPTRLLWVSSSITSDQSLGVYQDELARRLRLDLPIEDKLWESAYNEDLRLK